MSSMHDKQGRANARAVHKVMGRVVPISVLDSLGADAMTIAQTLEHIKDRINVNHSGAKALVAHALAQEADSEMMGGFSFGDFLSGAEKVLGTATRVGRIATGATRAAAEAAHRLRGAGFSFGDFLRGAKRVVGDVAETGLSVANAVREHAPLAARAASGVGLDRIAGLANRAGQIASYAPGFPGLGAGGLYIGGTGGYIVPAEAQYRVRGAGMSLGGLSLGGARKKSRRAVMRY